MNDRLSWCGIEEVSDGTNLPEPKDWFVGRGIVPVLRVRLPVGDLEIRDTSNEKLGNGNR